MKGLELSEKYYLEYGAPMIRESFPSLEGLLAVGLAGSGSECLGYDDGISEDHDFDIGFCIFIPDEDIIDSRTAFALERAYAKLPREFMGYSRSRLAPAGSNRRGIIRISDFFREHTGSSDGKLTLAQWFSVPEQSLLEATGGRVFRDDCGYFTSIRQRLAYFPREVWLKKLAGQLLLMGQSGQYNYNRCVSRGEYGGAQLAAAEFVKSAMSAIFLLNRKYMPYYKWSFRALRELEVMSELEEKLEFLISSPNRGEIANEKQEIIEEICRDVIGELRHRELSDCKSFNAEEHAYSVNDKIADESIRNLHVLFGV